MAKPELMCEYNSMRGYTKSNTWHGIDKDVLNEKAKRIRCPECGRGMLSAVRTCHDGCCINHCVPPHKKKGWYKVGKKKKTSRDTAIRKRK
ncbi:hypothetical protein CL614_00340 [archaeon]|nr:hypothetical protein [archaeon]